MKIHEAHRYLAAKVIGGLFALIIAPIVAGIASNFIQKKLDQSATPEKAEAAPGKTTNAEASSRKAEDTRDQEPSKPARPKAPTEGPVISLFNGKNLAGFHTFLGPSKAGGKPLGRDHDPDKVFDVTPEGWLRISGKVFGALETEDDYENYHLRLEYKWGDLRWPPREKMERLSGVVVHCSAPGESPNDTHTWRPGFRARIMDEQGTGDLALFPVGTTKLSVAVEADVHEVGAKHRGVRYDYVPGAPLVTVTGHALIHRRGASLTAPTPAEAASAETPTDAHWHTLECICAGERITIVWDGRKVLEASKLSQSRGKIHFVSEGAEIFFRDIQLRQLIND